MVSYIQINHFYKPASDTTLEAFFVEFLKARNLVCSSAKRILALFEEETVDLFLFNCNTKIIRYSILRTSAMAFDAPLSIQRDEKCSTLRLTL